VKLASDILYGVPLRPSKVAPLLEQKLQVRIGSCKDEDLACWVVTRVLSVYPSRKQFIIDAGGAALSKDSIADDGNGVISFKWGFMGMVSSPSNKAL